MKSDEMDGGDPRDMAGNFNLALRGTLVGPYHRFPELGPVTRMCKSLNDAVIKDFG